ncbi:hypothetical protein BDZ90DRAFT_227159 [Jaminaea rosea]|uniref:C2 domain-containing protein n=1 Tax=Jaminaea rosea TaxID=1569628 RepID=A0A316URE0_9BASI|nr:hypothetical protein BDZ90DRAFT_227159 [Jaminaea rosea]PWN27348.1 hypothetical protein BDZ90DRAFT_227159 [Jaminaea rosea]
MSGQTGFTTVVVVAANGNFDVVTAIILVVAAAAAIPPTQQQRLCHDKKAQGEQGPSRVEGQGDVRNDPGYASTHDNGATPPPPPSTPPKLPPRPNPAPSPAGNPIEPHLRLIIAFFAATSCVTLALSRVHWIFAALAAATGCFILCKLLLSRGQDIAASQRSAAAQQAFDAKDNTETVEWLNVVLGSVWPLISADLFTPFIDLLEDALQLQVPGIVHAVRVEDLDQGDVPLNVDSLKVLPPGEEHFLGGNAAVTSDARTDAEQAISDVDLGEHVNLEVTFSYRASSKGKSTATDGALRDDHSHAPRAAPAETIHLLLYLAIGLQKIAAVEVPVWCEVVGVQGKMRLRLQLVPALPFVKHVGFALLEQPRLEIKAKPLGRRMVIDAMNLPLLSSYVLRSIQTTVKPFVAPGSYTIDLGAIMGSGDGPKNTYAVGVIAVVIHSATDLPAADVNGLADPFVTLSFARAGKPLFRTRVLRKNKNPVWGGEVAYLLVGPDEVRDHDRLRFTIFDADRFSADDPLGKIDVSIDRLIKESLATDTDARSCALMETHEAELEPMRRGMSTQGRLRYSIVFAKLVQPQGCEGTMASPARSQLMDQAARRAREGQDDAQQAATGDTPQQQPANMASFLTPFDRFVHSLGLPLDESVLRARQARNERVTKLTKLLAGEEAAVASPPARQWPSGILAFHVHSIHGLEVTRTQRTLSKNSGAGSGGSGGAEDDEGGSAALDGGGLTRLPSSYVQVLLNDEAVLVTRVKTLNPRPFINAGSERFVTDFSRARVDFVVRDRRQREGDPILGVVSLDVAEVLGNSARWSGWCTMEGGLGYGKLRVTLLWRSVHLCVPRPLRGWSVGTLCVTGLKAQVGHQAGLEGREAHWVLDGRWGRAQTDSIKAEGVAMTYDYNYAGGLRLPMRSRYPSSLTLTLRCSTARLPGRHRRRVIGCLPLDRTLVDAERIEAGSRTLRVGLYATNDHRAVEALCRRATVGDVQGHRHAALRDLVKAPLLIEDEDQDVAHRSAASLSSDGSDVEGEDTRSRRSSGMHRRTSSGSVHPSLALVGHVDVTLAFIPGISDAHSSLLSGDHELRYAHEAWLCKRDAGMRTTPPGLDARDPNDLGDPCDEEQPLASPNGSEEDEELTSFLRSSSLNPSGADVSDYPSVRRRQPRPPSPPVGEEPSSSSSSRHIPSSSSFSNRMSQRHRQEAGLAQLKPYRTLRWLKQNVDDGMGNLRKRGLVGGMEKRDERVEKMEREGVSNF